MGDVILEAAQGRAAQMWWTHGRERRKQLRSEFGDDTKRRGDRRPCCEGRFLAAQFLRCTEYKPLLTRDSSFGGNAGFDEPGLDGGLDFFEEFFVEGRLVANFFLQGEEGFRLEIAES